MLHLAAEDHESFHGAPKKHRDSGSDGDGERAQGIHADGDRVCDRRADGENKARELAPRDGVIAEVETVRACAAEQDAESAREDARLLRRAACRPGGCLNLWVRDHLRDLVGVLLRAHERVGGCAADVWGIGPRNDELCHG